MLQKTKIILWVSLSLIVLDQITKIWVVENICYRGDDLCQEADGAFRVIDHASSSGVDGEIGDIRLDVEDTVVTGHVEAFGTDWPFEGSYEPEGRRIEAKLVDPSGAAFGQITTRKANVSPSGAIWWRSQIEISVGGDTPGEVQSALEESYSLRMDAAGIHVIEGLFQIVHSQNTGAAFGMFTEFKYRMAVFYVFTAFAVWVLWGLYKELEPNDRLGAWIVGLIVAGAIGNLIDRVHKQSVTDFLRVHWGADSWLTGIMRSPEWPSFNVADMAIVGGVGLFAIQYLFYEDKKGDDLEADSEPADMSETAEGDPKAAESEA